jgi:hypothetical protein
LVAFEDDADPELLPDEGEVAVDADDDVDELSDGVLFGVEPLSFESGLVPAESLPLAPVRESVR